MGFAMYFSRSVIPYIRGKEETEWLQAFNFLKHIGMYAYRRNILKEVTALPQSSLEIAESLEQLRWLQNGYKIKVGDQNTYAGAQPQAQALGPGGRPGQFGGFGGNRNRVSYTEAVVPHTKALGTIKKQFTLTLPENSIGIIKLTPM